MINNNDFAYMWCGREIKTLSPSEIEILKPINMQTRPAGRAILLLHGFTSSPAVYRAMLPQLTMYDAILCPVLPGHAESIAAFAAATAAQWLNCAESAFVKLSKKYNQVDVMGLSLGGCLALKIAEKYPVNRLFLLAPALKLHGWTGGILFLVNFLRMLGLRNLKNRGGNLHRKNFQELTYRQIPLSAAAQLLSLVQNNKFVIPSCPIELLVGRYDSVVDSTAVVKLFANAANTHIHWLENSAHVLSLDGDIDKILEVVRDSFT